MSGGSSGIGRAVAEAFGALGWQVALGARGEARLGPAADAVTERGGRGLALSLDVGDPDQVADRYWKGLDADNRVALAVKRIPASGGAAEIFLRNRFTRD